MAENLIDNPDTINQNDADETIAEEPKLQLNITLQDSINSALWENSVPFLLELAIDNQTAESWPELEVNLTAEPQAIQPYTWRLQHVTAGEYRALKVQDVRLNGPWLQQQNEASNADVSFTVTHAGNELLKETRTIRVLAKNEWGGLSGIPDILAAFVLPNDRAISRILRSASEILRQAGKDHGLEGYQSNRSRVWEQAQAIWCAVCALDIAYVSPPASFMETGQRVRLPSQIVEERLGTCLDTAVLFAACLEAAGLDPVIILTKGHAFSGVWLSKTDAVTSVVNDLPALRNRLKLDDIKVFETTLVTHAHKPGFAVACEKGEVQLRHADEDQDDTFREVIDIRRARLRRILPLSFEASQPSSTQENSDLKEVPQPVFEAAPALREETAEQIEEQIPATPADRISRWCTRLLDMSGRNRLLNLPKTEKQIVRIDCPDPAELENILAGMRNGRKSKALRLCSWPDVMQDGHDPRDGILHHDRQHEDAAIAYAREALKRRELLVSRTEKGLQSTLTELYRRAKAAEQEGGTNILYLTIGALAWTRDTSATAAETKWLAPLILVPVILERRSIRSGFELRAHADEGRINLTLLEMLRNDYNLHFRELEGDSLPEDEAGLDVGRIIDIFRAGLRKVPGWEVQDVVTLTTLSFAKFLMWKDLQDRRESLRINEVARRLLDGTTEPSPDTPDHSGFADTDGQLDDMLAQAGLICPMEADSSQLRAVARAARGENFVLIGPPGTGKSQTITNIIANTLAQGRTVLFVAEKRAALEVVRNRLKQISLAEFCLDLFSPKANKMAVLEQFQTAQNILEQFNEGDWQRTRDQIDHIRSELNAYVHDLHRQWRNGWTAYRAIGAVLRGDTIKIIEIPLSWPTPDAHDEAAYAALKTAAEDISSVHERIGDVISIPELAGLGQTEWGPQWEKDFLDASRDALSAAEHLMATTEAARKALALSSSDFSLPALQRLRGLCEQVTRPEAAAWAFSENADETRDALHAEQPHIDRHGVLEGEFTCEWQPTVFSLPLDELSKNWNEAKEKSVFQFLAKNKAQKAVRKALEAHTGSPLPEDCEDELKRLIEIQQIRTSLDAAPHAAAVGTILWKGLETDFEAVDRCHAWGQATRAALASCTSDVAVLLAARAHLKALFGEGRDLLVDGGAVQLVLAQFQTALVTLESAVQKLARLSGTGLETIAQTDNTTWLPTLCTRLNGWIDRARNLRDWCNWKLTCQRAEELGLRPLVEAVEQGMVPANETLAIFETNYARWWLAGVVQQSPLLRGFVAATHEKSIERFRALDRQLMTMASYLTRARLAGNIPDASTREQDAEYKVVTREVAKKARHLPIRQLAERMPHALRQLTPCLMMSPLSVAQYLPHDAQPFDLVIFDEASQIPTWDAIGVIGRGSQVIVVGDPKQLPPTDFFARGSGDSDDAQDAETCDLESILDECRGAGIPSVWLNWHYRSRHESLITFSNHAYYGGQLVAFPSPITHDRAVSFRYVSDGVYLRGAARTNPVEAHAVINTALTYLRDGTNRSLGIVTFNSEQQMLITDLLDHARESNPDIEHFFGDETVEPVLIRNLENVQGEERDVMLFSLTYGPDQVGHMTMNFGPLNRDGGERRLNVAVTRARDALVVFGSFKADNIDIKRTSAQGVIDLRKFLTFAEHGATALAGIDRGSVGDFDSQFEYQVASLLRDKGWQVVPQVGVSSFRIDLGVVDPDQPSIFLAGIECDGATYHRSATARDRDRLRQSVLEHLGWVILRIWSTDWWTNAPRECERIHQKLNELLTVSRENRAREEKEARIIETGDLPISDSMEESASSSRAGDLNRDHDDASKVALESSATVEPALAKRADITNSTGDSLATVMPDHDRFFDTDYTATLTELVAQHIAAYGPIREDILAQTISRQHGFGRAGREIRERIIASIPSHLERSNEDIGTFIWPEKMSPSDNDIAFPFPEAGESVEPATLPMEMLISLARTLSSRYQDESGIINGMRDACGMARMGGSTRKRCQAAAKGAIALS
ncbi:DUF3320 domain-containing protein [Komagataeibacter saccharivorans]|uniref:DUF3320 domain-containing protein n=1 Tax=Komagataeibacter saccharivorans TaxID=265959 RepID=UPI000C851D3C|nr:DUF3320 domain-containing protein [Komagataeibacter saccharivorans]